MEVSSALLQGGVGGAECLAVTRSSKRPIAHGINQTMFRIGIPDSS